MSDPGVDPLLERIDRDLEECDAGTMPPLARGGLVSAELVAFDERMPSPFVIPAGREPASVVYVGSDEPPLIEPRADQMRGWLTALFARRWFK